MNKYNLIETFFLDQSDYINFLISLKERVIANDEGNCFASLKKEDGHFIYTLTWQEDGKFVGDYIKQFKGTDENILTFNAGCKIISGRLSIYIETNKIELVPEVPPAFGILTHIKK